MTAYKLCLLTLCTTLVSTYPAALGAPAAAQTCEGDCNGDRSVTVDEIILGVSIALGDAPIGDCRAIDGDDNGAVTVDELLGAVSRGLQGCGDPVAPTSTPTPSNTPVPTTGHEAALAASVRVATEPIFRLFDFQARVGTPGGVPGRSSGSGCQQFDCVASGHVTGTEEDCCSDRQFDARHSTSFSQVFDNCLLDGDLGGFVSLNGVFVLASDNVDVCTGAIPVGAGFTASLSNFTHDVFFPDGSFSRTFQELTETFEVTPGGCTVSQPEQFGFGIRGDGHRFIDGKLQQFHNDSFGNVLVDIESDVHALATTVVSRQEAGGCAIDAALNGSMTNADFRAGRQFSTDFADFHVVQRPQAAALLLRLNGTVGTDCLGDVTLSTVEPLLVAPGDACFTGGRLKTQRQDETVSVTYAESGLDFDFGADGSLDQHFSTCTDVPADQCSTSVVGLCGACNAVNQCQGGLSCFSCGGNCTGTTKRCNFADTFDTCEDGVF